jgi:ribosomal protein S18 acetylase RimI-like enzyme
MLPTIETLDHRDRAVAERVHAIQLAAYTQEARLLGVTDFPPLRQNIESIQRSEEQFLGAFVQGTLAGIAAIEQTPDAATICISSLVVMPAMQRRGVASALLREVLRRFGSHALVVSTAVGNGPALALYGSFGFAELDRRFAGSLELVRLGRATMPPEPHRKESS